MLVYSISPHRLFFSPVRAFCADTPAPPVGPSALTPPPRGRLCAVHGLLGPAPRAGPHPRRSTGARRRGRGTGPRLAACTSALRPRARAGPGLGSTIVGSARGRSRTDSALRSGCRAQPGPVCNVMRPTHCAARARPPGGPLRRRRRMSSTIGSSAGPLSDRGRSTSRQPGPGWARTALSRDSRLRGARGPRRVRCVAAGGRESRDGRRARGGRRLRSPSESLRLGLVRAWESGRTGVRPSVSPRRLVAQHPLALSNRPQAKQVSSNESPAPGVPCRELSQ